jgi:nitrogen fixation/metabolism regulation signal transduction histidine kinase
VTIFAAVFLLAAVVIFALLVLSPNAADPYQPFLLTTFIVALFVSLVCIVWLLRGILRPYNQLISEAERAPVPHSAKPQNEAAFVLETFQSVVAQLQAQQQELERLSADASQRADSAERFSERIVASMPTGLIAFDLSGKATVANPPARALFDSQPTVEGEHYRTIFRDVPALAEMVNASLTAGRTFRRAEVESSDLANPKRFGATVAPIDPSPSGAKGAVCLITDITEVTQLREQVALKRNLENLGEMSAGLAHEFKNAMAALHGYAQFLQNADHNEQTKGAADALVQEVRSLSDMTTAFLNFAKPQTLQLDQVSLPEILRDCAAELEPLYEKRKVELTIESSANAPDVNGDPRMLRQALLNLLRNAAEAFADSSDSRKVFVTVSNETLNGQRSAIVSIRDTGPGICAADIQKVFIPFFTTKASGHGVGLPLAHRIISQHGGSLTAANASQRGAVFTIRLPSG